MRMYLKGLIQKENMVKYKVIIIHKLLHQNNKMLFNFDFRT
jgi:hypothetical protein